MGATGRKRGRPRGYPRGESDKINELAFLLRDQLDNAAMSIRQLCDAFTEEQFSPTPKPGHATVSRRLNGEGLTTQRRLVEAIIAVCTPANRADAVRKEALALLHEASRPPEPEASRPPQAAAKPGERPADVALLRTEVARLSRRLITRQDELAWERKLRAEAEQLLSWYTGTTNTQTGHQHDNTSANETQDALTVLEASVRRMTAERNEAQRALADARRHIEDLEAQLAPLPGPPPARQLGPTTTVTGGPDTELEALVTEIRALDPDGIRFAARLRRTLDQQLDGVHTGRFNRSQLSKTEKAATAAYVKLELIRAFGFADGLVLDFQLNGIDFDYRFSTGLSWTIPHEAISSLVFLVWVNDDRSRWSTGVLRADAHLLAKSSSQDGRRALTREGRSAVRWIHEEAVLPENVLLHVPDTDVTEIFAPQSAQQRVDELLRRVQGKPITFTTLSTVAMEEDSAKRARNSRALLRREGIVVLGATAEGQAVATQLGLPVAGRSEWVSARIALLNEDNKHRPSVEVGGQRWVLANSEDPVVEAPLLR
jgi:hypothetical protein